MEVTSDRFAENVQEALADTNLRAALERLARGFPVMRRAAVDRLPEFEALRDEAVAIKNHTLANLDFYLETAVARIEALGGTVHWCRDGAAARDVILAICQAADARTVTKSKSMVCEEIALNDHLQAHGVEPVETDLGEYIIQLRDEPPSHIIAPAIHLSKEQVADTFRDHHRDLPGGRSLDEPRELLDEARSVLRQRFVVADVGITGANMLVAETGSIVVVTNEGNADLTMTLPRVHIAVTGIEKVVPTLEDAATVLRVLARSATGQEQSVYTTLATGPKRQGDLDGPEEFHLVLLDNGRSAMLGGPFHEALRCIRCGACLNHCPVYGAIGGHAYGWVYSGPIGAVLTPNLIGIERSSDLPNASTLCGKCEEVCPMRIPLPRMLRHWRERQAAVGAERGRLALAAWAFLAQRPGLYRWVTGFGVRLLAILATLAGGRGHLRRLPFADGWTKQRDLPAPPGRTFMALWASRGASEGAPEGASGDATRRGDRA